MSAVEKRYWDRVGMYITKEFAEEWISKMSVSDGTGGRHLDEEVEEYVVARPITPDELRAEIIEIFEQPFEEVELPKDVRAILFADKMERNRVSRLKELKVEGNTLDEAKEIFQQELDEGVAEILDVEVGSLSVGMGSASEEDSGADTNYVE